MSSEKCQNQAAYISSLIKSGKKIIPFNQRCLPPLWSEVDKNIAFVDLSDYGEIEDHSASDQVMTVGCGIKMHKLEQFLTKNKQWFPVSYPDRETSLLDLILSGSAGPLEIVNGGLRRHILGLSFVLSNGEIAHAGGRVVKNVSGYDLTRFFIGSYGYFVLPIKAHLRLYALPEKSDCHNRCR